MTAERYSMKRLNEVTMVWNFGGRNNEYHRDNPPPLILVDFDGVPLLKTEILLSGTLGKLKSEFGLDRYDPSKQVQAYCELLARIRAKLKGLRFYVPLSEKGDSWFGGGRFGFEISFQAESGQAFTVTAVKVFKEFCTAIYGPVADWSKMPIPNVSSRMFWILGDRRVELGMALALDMYMDNGFQRVRQKYMTEGLSAAYRLFNSLWRSLRNDPYHDKIQSDKKGFEILIGKRNINDNSQEPPCWQACYTLSLDGWDMHCSKSNILNSDWPLRDSFGNVAKQFCKTMTEYNIRRYSLMEGLRTRDSTNERVACDKLSPDELSAFQSEMREYHCYPN